VRPALRFRTAWGIGLALALSGCLRLAPAGLADERLRIIADVESGRSWDTTIQVEAGPDREVPAVDAALITDRPDQVLIGRLGGVVAPLTGQVPWRVGVSLVLVPIREEQALPGR
jgi:hypothetical protein